VEKHKFTDSSIFVVLVEKHEIADSSISIDLVEKHKIKTPLNKYFFS